MNLRHLFGLAAAFLIVTSAARAADLAGHWTAEFDSQIGVQKYSYDFAVKGDKIAGKAAYEHSMGKGENELTAIKLAGDDLSFTETLKFDGNEIVVTYTGTISGDDLKLTRQGGDY